MKALGRSYVFWPGIGEEIKRHVQHCDKCAIASKSPKKTTLSSWPITNKPWERLHVDYAEPINGFYYLVLVDSFTKWPEIYETQSITSTNAIRLLKQSFSRFGLPEILVSDNGTQFSSVQFEEFCKKTKWNSTHSYCSISPTIQWTGRKIRGHSEKSFKET